MRSMETVDFVAKEKVRSARLWLKLNQIIINFAFQNLEKEKQLCFFSLDT